MQSVACCGSVETTLSPPLGADVAAALQDQVSPLTKRTKPTLARPQPTGLSRPISTAAGRAVSATGQRAPAGGLVVSGMGLAALAGLAAWFSRRRRADDDQPIGAEVPDHVENVATQAGPRLSVLRVEANDAREERRILPPT
jgi:hypothetical protein